MKSKFKPAQRAIDVLDALPETVRELSGSHDAQAVAKAVRDTQSALDALNRHHTQIAAQSRKAAVSANGRSR